VICFWSPRILTPPSTPSRGHSLKYTQTRDTKTHLADTMTCMIQRMRRRHIGSCMCTCRSSEEIERLIQLCDFVLRQPRTLRELFLVFLNPLRHWRHYVQGNSRTRKRLSKNLKIQVFWRSCRQVLKQCAINPWIIHVNQAHSWIPQFRLKQFSIKSVVMAWLEAWTFMHHFVYSLRYIFPFIRECWSDECLTS